MNWVYDDGGRAEAGFKGVAGDCAARALAIGLGLDYRFIYDDLTETVRLAAQDRKVIAQYVAERGATPRRGTLVSAVKAYLQVLGWTWVPTMHIGSGCKVHLRAEELPAGTVIARLSKHICTVIDGVIHDTYDCSRDGTRCVYGYWTPPAQQTEEE